MTVYQLNRNSRCKRSSSLRLHFQIKSMNPDSELRVISKKNLFSPCTCFCERIFFYYVFKISKRKVLFVRGIFKIETTRRKTKGVEYRHMVVLQSLENLNQLERMEKTDYVSYKLFNCFTTKIK